MSSSYKPIAQGRRTPLTLNSGGGGPAKTTFKPSPSPNENSSNTKKDHNKTASSNQKPEHNMQKVTVELKKMQPQQTNAAKSNNSNAATTNQNKNTNAADEKKSQNGHAAANTNGNARDKQLNGSQERPKESQARPKSVAEKANDKPESAKEKDVSKKPEQEARSTRNNAETSEKKAAATAEKKEAERKEAEKKELAKQADKKEQAKEAEKKELAKEVEKKAAPKEVEKKEVEKKEAEKSKDASKPSTPTSTRSSDKKTPTPSPSRGNMQKPSTPKLSVSNASLTSTPNKKSSATPNKAVTVAIDVDLDDEDDEVAAVEDDKDEKMETEEEPTFAAAPAAVDVPKWTSTPGKFKPTDYSVEAYKLEKGPLPDRNSCPRSFSQISGRRSIRNFASPAACFDNHYRETYRRINTELDCSNNTSLNVTVGSELANNSSFSFSFFGRKRQLPTPAQSTTELQTDENLSPKRRRVEFKGLFSAVASPFTRLGERLARASLMSPFKPRNNRLTNGDCEEDDSEEQEQEQDVHNVSNMQDDLETDTTKQVDEKEAADEVSFATADANNSESKDKQAEEVAVEETKKTDQQIEAGQAAEDAKIEVEGEKVKQDNCSLEAVKADTAELAGTTSSEEVGEIKNKRCALM